MFQQIWWRPLHMYFAYMNYLLLLSKMLVLSVLALLSLIPGCWTTCRTTSSSATAIAVSSPSATRSAASSPGTTRSSTSGSKSPASVSWWIFFLGQCDRIWLVHSDLLLFSSQIVLVVYIPVVRLRVATWTDENSSSLPIATWTDVYLRYAHLKIQVE